ncbi:MAG TPA: hypothetical protein VGF25_05510 [Thermoleophilaceae bacterium]
MQTRIVLAIALAAAAAAATATTAAPATAAVLPCGTATAAGKTWHVQAAGVRCVTARGIVRRVAVRKPDRVIHRAGGEVDAFATSFSGLRCSRSQKPRVGGAINCTSADGKRSVEALYRG